MKLSEDVKKYIIGIYLHGFDEGRRYKKGNPFLLKKGFEDAFKIIETGEVPTEWKDSLDKLCYCQISGNCECGG